MAALHSRSLCPPFARKTRVEKTAMMDALHREAKRQCSGSESRWPNAILGEHSDPCQLAQSNRHVIVVPNQGTKLVRDEQDEVLNPANAAKSFDQVYINGRFVIPHGRQLADLANPTKAPQINKGINLCSAVERC
jgi:hypothetical protein